VDGTAEEHLRIGALEDAGDAGAPLELLLSVCMCPLVPLVLKTVCAVNRLQSNLSVSSRWKNWRRPST